MRLSSVTLPSCIGTLKSTRMRTRLPLRSISFTVFLFMNAPRVYSRQENRYTRNLLVYLSAWILLQTLCDHGCQISRAAGITPFVVIPCNNLHHIANDKRIQGAIYG